MFAPGADGNAAPIRTFGVNGGGFGCQELAVDGNGNIVCALINTLSADALPDNVDVRNLGFDAAGNLYVYEIGTKGEPTVVRFTSAANGFSPPPTTESLVSFPIYFGGAMGFAVD